MFSNFVVKSLLFLTYASVTKSQLVRKCMCSEVEPCRQAYLDNIAPCAEKCKRFAVKAGINVDKIKECATSFGSHVNETFQCVESTYSDSCSKEVSTKKLPKRHTELIKANFMNEISKDMAAKGVLIQWNRLNAKLTKYQNCIKLCLNMATSNCDARLDCTLELPDERTLIADTKACVNKVNVPKRWCECAVDGGLQDLKDICDKFQ
ncbi:unnamed protein product [Bursaphelenchus okinawaensis]|uniref:DUF19 domain-containing protein n=1 Tax=Bursaphelenchus okinawaensis TaxID=465554 RepID=A0A811JWF8_9BILA|nr:unnamed protein product [Bursaphelenchus okinawaensis]CAG9086206.1 unnamed protein product [Bursaphelenchus okinawaensis]